MIEAREREMLSPFAVQSAQTRGRRFPMTPCDLRGEFQRDRDRILHCKSFRRLKHKTQMLLSPTGDHYRTRLTHTMEVSQIARTIARALRLNEDLTEAIALGHDLGHPPFGHSGERTISAWMPGGFVHSRHSLRVVDRLEREGRGLNLTWEVRDGILHHTGEGTPATLEGQAVSVADRIAYINHDIEDAILAGILTAGHLPGPCLSVLGQTHGERIRTMVADVVTHSVDQPAIRTGEEVSQASLELRAFLFKNVYCLTIDEFEEKRTAHVLTALLNYYEHNPEELPPLTPAPAPQRGDLEMGLATAEDTRQRVCDWVAGMSDGYAVNRFVKLFVPAPVS